MKDFNLLVWVTQLGMGVALPLGGFIYLSLWLKNRYALGVWIIFCGAAVGLTCAISSLRSALKTMEQMTKAQNKQNTPPPISFNDHD